MPRHKSVHTIFESFVASLSDLIKAKVGEAVNTATNDFLTSKFGAAKKATDDEPKPKRRYRRRKATPKVEAKPVHRRRRAKKVVAPKPIRLSKHGKRLGRPPKDLAADKPAE